MDEKSLMHFLARAKQKCYASETREHRVQPFFKGSKQMEYSEGTYRYVDAYFGEVRFSGIEAVYSGNTPVWSMTYSGGILPGSDYGMAGDIFRFLKAALREPDLNCPVRGPPEFSRNGFAYTSSFSGGFWDFTGSEKILHREDEVYSLHFSGGRIVIS